MAQPGAFDLGGKRFAGLPRGIPGKIGTSRSARWAHRAHQAFAPGDPSRQGALTLPRPAVKLAKMDILLIHPPDEMEAMLGSGKEFVQKYEPLGLLYVAAVARQLGHEVSVIDAHAEGVGCEELKKRIAAARPDIVGVSVLTCSGGIAYDLGRWIKENLPGTFVVFGNVHASVFAEAYLRNGCCDAVVHGEGEHAFARIAEHRAGRGGLGEIPGVSFRDGDRVVNTGARNLVEDLVSLPRPSRDLVDRRLYNLDTISNQIYVGKARSTSKTMCTSRGCWYKCTFCVVNQRPRFDSPE